MTMSEARFDGVPPGAAPQTAPPQGTPPPTSSRAAAALDGILSGGLALGLATLFAGVMGLLGAGGSTPSPIPAVGSAFIDRTPSWLKEFAIGTFGTNDKLALLVGMGCVLVALCAAIGVLVRTRHTAGLVLLSLVGALGAAAVLTRPDAAPQDIIPTVIGTIVGVRTLGRLQPAGMPSEGKVTRRRVLAGGGAALAALLGARLTGGNGQASVARAEVALPPAGAAPSVAGGSLDIPGVTPYVVDNRGFYRIDTALVVPRLDTATWSVKVVGEVEQDVSLDWATLLTKPMQQRLVTLTCVSNEVGGDLIGNAVWTGWPVRELLAMARPKGGADMVLSRSSDGFTAGTPIEALTDERDALLAIGMNGQPLPFEHGFPVRLVVPGLYGYVSATKWLTELKVTRFSADEGYWTPRGWSAKGPIKTASRIDVPRNRATVPAGTVAVAGVAWAQHRGIDKVEVQVDGGPWQVARLAGEPSIDAWRQWVYEWPATAGPHTLKVRATDRTGAVQIADEAPPAPDGATGLHTINVTVS